MAISYPQLLKLLNDAIDAEVSEQKGAESDPAPSLEVSRDKVRLSGSLCGWIEQWGSVMLTGLVCGPLPAVDIPPPRPWIPSKMFADKPAPPPPVVTETKTSSYEQQFVTRYRQLADTIRSAYHSSECKIVGHHLINSSPSEDCGDCELVKKLILQPFFHQILLPRPNCCFTYLNTVPFHGGIQIPIEEIRSLYDEMIPILVQSLGLEFQPDGSVEITGWEYLAIHNDEELDALTQLIQSTEKFSPERCEAMRQALRKHISERTLERDYRIEYHILTRPTELPIKQERTSLPIPEVSVTSQS